MCYTPERSLSSVSFYHFSIIFKGVCILMFNNNNTRIQLDMSIKDAVIAMSNGNPGALSVCMQILEQGSIIDPQDAFGGFGALMQLDMLGIYDERIWMFYKDVCAQHLGKMLAVIRANQSGQVVEANKDSIAHAIDNYGDGLDVEAVVEALKQKLPTFCVDAYKSLNKEF